MALSDLDLRQRDVEAFYRESRAIAAGLSSLTPDDLGDQLVKFVGNLHKAAGKMEAEKLRVVTREFTDGLLTIKRRGDVLTSVERNGVTVRVMARLGWLDDVTEGDIDDMKPSEVTRLNREFNALLEEAYEIPGE